MIGNQSSVEFVKAQWWTLGTLLYLLAFWCEITFFFFKNLKSLDHSRMEGGRGGCMERGVRSGLFVLSHSLNVEEARGPGPSLGREGIQDTAILSLPPLFYNHWPRALLDTLQRETCFPAGRTQERENTSPSTPSFCLIWWQKLGHSRLLCISSVTEFDRKNSSVRGYM